MFNFLFKVNCENRSSFRQRVQRLGKEYIYSMKIMYIIWNRRLKLLRAKNRNALSRRERDKSKEALRNSHIYKVRFFNERTMDLVHFR